MAYSNTGYYILGLTIEKITGQTLATELSQRIFRPLELSHTSLPSTPALPGRSAHGYTPEGADTLHDISHISPSILWAAGGIVSTPRTLPRSNARSSRDGCFPPHSSGRCRPPSS